MTNDKYFVISCFMDVKIKAEFRYTHNSAGELATKYLQYNR